MIHSFTEQEILEISGDIKKVIERNKIKYSDDLVIDIVSLADHHFSTLNLVRLPNFASTRRVEQFIDNFNTVFASEGEDYIITFQKQYKIKGPKGKTVKKLVKDWKVVFDDKLITDWIVKTLRSAMTRNEIPMDIGAQIFNSYLTGRIADRKYTIYQPSLNGVIYEHKDVDQITNETITLFAIPLLKYLNNNTKIKKPDNQFWTLSQLGFVIEVLIALNLYQSKGNNPFTLGISKPTIADKKYLQSILNNKLKQGFIHKESGTQD
jgi:hypothetical protein